MRTAQSRCRCRSASGSLALLPREQEAAGGAQTRRGESNLAAPEVGRTSDRTG